MLSKFCPSCGTQSTGGKFCMNCGASLELPDQQSAEPVKTAETIVNQPETVSESTESAAYTPPVYTPPAYTPPVYTPVQTPYTPQQSAQNTYTPPASQGAYSPAGVAPTAYRPVQGGYGAEQAKPQPVRKKGGAGKAIAIIAGCVVGLAALVVGGLFVVGKIAENKEASAVIEEKKIDAKIKGNDCFKLLGSESNDVVTELGKPTGEAKSEEGLSAKYKWGYVYYTGDGDGKVAETILISKPDSGLAVEGLDVGVPLDDALERLGGLDGYAVIGEANKDGLTAVSCADGDKAYYMTLQSEDGLIKSISITAAEE